MKNLILYKKKGSGGKTVTASVSRLILFYILLDDECHRLLSGSATGSGRCRCRGGSAGSGRCRCRGSSAACGRDFFRSARFGSADAAFFHLEAGRSVCRFCFCPPVVGVSQCVNGAEFPISTGGTGTSSGSGFRTGRLSEDDTS